MRGRMVQGAAIISAIIICFVSGVCFSEEKFTASDREVDDFFGTSVGLSGDVCVIGAKGDDSSRGSCYVFRFEASTWVEEQKLTAPDGEMLEEFGSSVSIEGNVCAVGADSDEIGGLLTGSAYIFRYNGTSWIEQQKLTASDAAHQDYFGTSVSIEGDVCAVGAPFNDSSGSAYIFRYNGSNWVQQQKLTASDGAPQDFFGISVCLSGDVCIVGAKRDDSLTGSAYIFRYDGSNWIEEQKVTASDGEAGDWFGCSVSLDANVCVVGAYCDQIDGVSKGSAYVFRYNGTNWIEQQRLSVSDGSEGDFFGGSVSIDANICVVGSPCNGFSGSAYVFRYEDGNWDEWQKLTAFDGAADDNFGTSLSVGASLCLVGAPADDSFKGSAYLFGPEDYSGTQGVKSVFKEFQVNTYTTNDQKYGAVAVNEEGDFVVTWSCTDRIGVYGRLFGANGAALGGEFKIGTGVDSDVAMCGNGNFVVTWVASDGSCEGIFARLYEANGQPVTGAFHVNDYTSSRQIHPGVAANENGSFVILWNSAKPGGTPTAWHICGKLYDCNGPVGGEFIVTEDSEPFPPDAAMDDGGDFTVIYEGGLGYYVLMRRYNANGIPKDEPEYVTENLGARASPSIDMTAGGNFVISWNWDPGSGFSNADIYAKVYNSLGAVIIPRFLVNNYTAGGQFNPSVSMKNNGQFVIIWQGQGEGDGSGVFGQRYDSDGTAIGEDFRINRYVVGSQDESYVAMKDDGEFVAVWQSGGQDGDGLGIFGGIGPRTGCADFSGDMFVNFIDFCFLAQEWLRQGSSLQTDLVGDNKIDEPDLAAFTGQWLQPCYDCNEFDVFGDGRIDFKDYALLAGNWLGQGLLAGDVTGDGIVNWDDLKILAAHWLMFCHENRAPIADAGGDYEVVMPFSPYLPSEASESLDGTVEDEGLSSELLNIRWSKISGPCMVTFEDDAAVDTNATFYGIGTYKLQLEADDGERTGTNTAYVTVLPNVQKQEEGHTKLTASDAEAGDMFGISVDIDGSTAVVGAYHDCDNGPNSGSAYVFTRGVWGWQQQQKLTALDAAAGDEFGCSVTIDANTIVVGSRLEGGEAGSAYVFTRSGSTWSQQQKLTAQDGSSGNRFGNCVSVDGNTIVVGAYQDDPCGTDSGSAYIFTYDGSNWSQQQKYIPDDGSAGDLFGYSVSVDGNTAVIGAYKNDPCGTDSGSAYVITRSGSTWSLQQKLIPEDGDANDHFGYSVDIWDYVVSVGAPGWSNSAGAAYTFVRYGSTWSLDNKMYDNDDPNDSEYFGYSVATGEERDVVGVSSNLVEGVPAGSVYELPVFLGIYSEAEWHTDPEGASGDNFGCSVSMYENYFIVGAGGDDDNGTDSGSAFIFEPGVPFAEEQSVVAYQTIPEPITLEGYDPDNGPNSLTYEITEYPSHGELQGDTPELTYTADSAYNGYDYIRFRTYDGLFYSGEATITISVLSP